MFNTKRNFSTVFLFFAMTFLSTPGHAESKRTIRPSRATLSIDATRGLDLGDIDATKDPRHCGRFLASEGETTDSESRIETYEGDGEGSGAGFDGL